MESQKNQSNRIIPLTKWNEYHSFPSESSLRWLVFNKESNGFKKVIRRCGRRVLISEKDFFDWLDSNQENGGA